MVIQIPRNQGTNALMRPNQQEDSNWKSRENQSHQLILTLDLIILKFKAILITYFFGTSLIITSVPTTDKGRLH